MKKSKLFRNYEAPEIPIEFRGDWTKMIRGMIFNTISQEFL